MGEWINLKSCPPKDASSKKMRSWTEERIAVMEAKLHELTGKTWEELWPDELRENHEFLNAPKSIEKVYNWQQAAMLNYAAATRQRLSDCSNPAVIAEADSEFAIRKDAVAKSIHLLTERDRKVLSLRFGFGCDPQSLSDAGKAIGVTQERVRQIEAKALTRLKQFANLSLIGNAEFKQEVAT
jgi:RNA polymerase sigma factor (sigma-70 family)